VPLIEYNTEMKVIIGFSCELLIAEVVPILHAPEASSGQA